MTAADHANTVELAAVVRDALRLLDRVDHYAADETTDSGLVELILSASDVSASSAMEALDALEAAEAQVKTVTEDERLERINRAFEFVPLNLYDEITKLAEAALGEILAALDALEAQAKDAEADNTRLREALEEIERAAKVGITQKNRLPDLVGILATARAALATDRTEAQP